MALCRRWILWCWLVCETHYSRCYILHNGSVHAHWQLPRFVSQYSFSLFLVMLLGLPYSPLDIGSTLRSCYMFTAHFFHILITTTSLFMPSLNLKYFWHFSSIHIKWVPTANYLCCILIKKNWNEFCICHRVRIIISIPKMKETCWWVSILTGHFQIEVHQRIVHKHNDKALGGTLTIVSLALEALAMLVYLLAGFRDTWIFLDNRVMDAFDLRKTIQEVLSLAFLQYVGFSLCLPQLQTFE